MKRDYASTPWIKGKYDDWRDATGEKVCAYGVNISSVMSSPTRQDRGTADFIFLAVNMHDEMLAALIAAEIAVAAGATSDERAKARTLIRDCLNKMEAD